MPSKSSTSKPVKKGTPVLFDACLPPQIRGESGPNPTLLLAFGRSGKLTHLKCSAELYERVNGAPVEDGPHTGYDNLRDHNFVVWVDGDTALSVDRINMRLVSLPQRNSPEPDKPTPPIVVDIETDTGDVYLREVPNGVRGAALMNLVIKLGALKQIKKDQAILPGYTVRGIDADGNIELSWPRGGVRATTGAGVSASQR